jgi:hypothetical protein
MIPPRRISQRLHPDEGLPQASNQNQPPFQQPSTQAFSVITEAAEHPTFGNILEVQPQQANMSTITTGTSQTSRSDQHLNTNPPLPSQVNQDEAELNQIEVQDWDKAEEDEAEAEENELIKVQHEIERLRQEQESIMRRQASTQCVEAHRQHINREHARLAELQYAVDILCQQEQRQDPLLDQRQQHFNTNPPPPNYHIPPPPPPNHYIPITNHHHYIPITNHHHHRIINTSRLRRNSAPHTPKIQ